jgi:hypothetical protein
MQSTKQFVVGSKAKASKYNQPKNKVNFEKSLLLQQVIEQSRINNKKTKKKK